MADANPRTAPQEAATCPNCGSGAYEIFYEVESVPTNSCLLLESREAARDYSRGDIRLAFCEECGFIGNVAFDEALTEYSGRYEETQGFSETFNAFHRKLAGKLIDKFDLRGKDVLEIGCGKGEFITLLSEMGENRGVGFDPSYHEERNTSEAARRVTFIKDFYSEKYAEQKADFVCCKMTLEHIPRTGSFMEVVRRTVGDDGDTIVFFQVPEATRILRDCAFEDIYYEHCSYFTPASLGSLFQSRGFDIIDVQTDYGDQYLTIEARPRSAPGGGIGRRDADLQDLRELVRSFPQRCGEKLDAWRERLREWRRDGKRVVLWGSGSKGVSFLTTLKEAGFIENVVDVNPHRQGYYMAGTGQKIVGPEALESYRPDVVVIMNRVYTDEISADLRARGLSPEIVAL